MSKIKTPILAKLKSLLPVSRAAHEEALAKTKQAAEHDQKWLLGQMQQTVRRNIALESVVAQHGIEVDTQEG